MAMSAISTPAITISPTPTPTLHLLRATREWDRTSIISRTTTHHQSFQATKEILTTWFHRTRRSRTAITTKHIASIHTTTTQLLTKLNQSHHTQLQAAIHQAPMATNQSLFKHQWKKKSNQPSTLKSLTALFNS